MRRQSGDTVDRADQVHRARERGSASLLVALGIVVLCVLGAAGAVLVSVLSVRSSVSAAADLGALAGASASLDQPGQECRRAEAVVRANRARMLSCRTVGTEVWIVAGADSPPGVSWLLPGRHGQLRSRAHAVLVPDDGAG